VRLRYSLHTLRAALTERLRNARFRLVASLCRVSVVTHWVSIVPFFMVRFHVPRYTGLSLSRHALSGFGASRGNAAIFKVTVRNVPRIDVTTSKACAQGQKDSYPEPWVGLRGRQESSYLSDAQEFHGSLVFFLELELDISIDVPVPSTPVHECFQIADVFV